MTPLGAGDDFSSTSLLVVDLHFQVSPRNHRMGESGFVDFLPIFVALR